MKTRNLQRTTLNIQIRNGELAGRHLFGFRQTGQASGDIKKNAARSFSNLQLSGACGSLGRALHMSIRAFFGGAAFLAVLIAGFTADGAKNSAVPEPGDLRAAGTVDFPVSCTPAVRAEFVRGVALLHSFFYEEARRIFTSVAEQDPKCAMAQW
jgi:hypothetical protein